jgi:hypothetical protein
MRVARRVFFSFYFERDIWRANQVRNSWVTQEDREAAGFWDASLWEKAKKEGEEAVKRMINGALTGTSVTVVLIGAETASRQWVRYEIAQSIKGGNGLVGIYIHNLKTDEGETDTKGPNPLEDFAEQMAAAGYGPLRTYDWAYADGYHNVAAWIEEAYGSAPGRR